MKSITAVGFDLDYTLASYKPSTFETLAHEVTVDKLVKHFGYPSSLYDDTFDWRYMSRGLVIDKKRGNILKVDRHKYCKLAYHGFKELSRKERMETYNTSNERLEFEEPGFGHVDTLFSLAESHLFMRLVEMHDVPDKHKLPSGKSYADIYKDVRGAVDLCHRDGSIKREVARNPAKYIYSDPGLVPVLEMLRQSGKKVFLATNSLWDYSSVVMNWLIDGKVGAEERDDKWLEYFDVVIVGCGKPRFFTERKDLFEVHPQTGMLWNTEGGSPMVPVGIDDLPSIEIASSAPENISRGGNASSSSSSSSSVPKSAENSTGTSDSTSSEERARVFQGGSYLDLHKMLGVKAGAELLYVGDHVYSDLLRGKKGANWRTMLVIPELESELDTLSSCGSNMEELAVLRQQRDALEDQIQRLEWRLRDNNTIKTKEMAIEMKELEQEGIDADEECENGAAQVESALFEKLKQNLDKNNGGGNNGSSISSSISSFSDSILSSSDDDSAAEATIMDLLENLREQRDLLRTRHRSLLQAHHEAFHPVWGQLFKTGYQRSLYAHQVERFACLYTSHVSNLMFYSPLKSYRGRVDEMSHEEATS
jgi:HAD superfamily 5'-nucleotidase-like hydrolase